MRTEFATPTSSPSSAPFRSATIRRRYGKRWRASGGRRCQIWRLYRFPRRKASWRDRLLAVAPPGLAHVVFTNSGAESVEAAIKLARCRTGRTGILAARNAFHGLTLAGMSATDTQFFQRGFGAPVPGFSVVPFGDVTALQAAMEARPGFFAAFHG